MGIKDQSFKNSQLLNDKLNKLFEDISNCVDDSKKNVNTRIDPGCFDMFNYPPRPCSAMIEIGKEVIECVAKKYICSNNDSFWCQWNPAQKAFLVAAVSVYAGLLYNRGTQPLDNVMDRLKNIRKQGIILDEIILTGDKIQVTIKLV